MKSCLRNIYQCDSHHTFFVTQLLRAACALPLILSDVPMVTDGDLITSRPPIDVADFSKTVESWLTKDAGVTKR